MYQNMQVSDGYGNFESNGITDYWHEFREGLADTVDLEDPALDKIVRLRMLGDGLFPFLDVSYCYGVLKDGTKVRVSLPRHQFSKRNLKGDIIDMCKRAGVYAKGLGLLDDINVWSVLS